MNLQEVARGIRGAHSAHRRSLAANPAESCRRSQNTVVATPAPPLAILGPITTDKVKVVPKAKPVVYVKRHKSGWVTTWRAPTTDAIGHPLEYETKREALKAARKRLEAMEINRAARAAGRAAKAAKAAVRAQKALQRHEKRLAAIEASKQRGIQEGKRLQEAHEARQAKLRARASHELDAKRQPTA